MRFDSSRFDQFIVENKVIGFFENPIQLKSGRESSWYVNWRTPTSDVFLMDQVTGFLLDFIEDHDLRPDCIFGVPEGATKLGVIASYKWAQSSAEYAASSHCLSMGRAKPKPHGHPNDRYFVGPPRGRTVVIEDVTTTGMSLIKTLDDLIEAGVNVAATISLTHRMQKRDDGTSVKSYLEKKFGTKFPHLSMSYASSLLPLAARAATPSKEVISRIEREFEAFGEEPILF